MGGGGCGNTATPDSAITLMPPPPNPLPRGEGEKGVWLLDDRSCPWRAVRWLCLRHAAVPVVSGTVRHAGDDELRQSGTWRLCHARRLRDRDLDGPRLAIPRHPALRVRWLCAGQCRVRALAVPPPVS